MAGASRGSLDGADPNAYYAGAAGAARYDAPMAPSAGGTALELGAGTGQVALALAEGGRRGGRRRHEALPACHRAGWTPPPFERAGVPTLAFHTGWHEQDHRPSGRVEPIDRDALAYLPSRRADDARSAPLAGRAVPGRRRAR